MFLGRISDGSAEGVGKIEIKYISRWLRFSPLDFSFATCLAFGEKGERMGGFWTGGEPAPVINLLFLQRSLTQASTDWKKWSRFKRSRKAAAIHVFDKQLAQWAYSRLDRGQRQSIVQVLMISS